MTHVSRRGFLSTADRSAAGGAILLFGGRLLEPCKGNELRRSRIVRV